MKSVGGILSFLTLFQQAITYHNHLTNLTLLLSHLTHATLWYILGLNARTDTDRNIQYYSIHLQTTKGRIMKNSFFIMLFFLFFVALINPAFAGNNDIELVSIVSNTLGFEPNSSSFNPAISSDGRYTAFDSLATNLVFRDTNSNSDVFVRDNTTGVVERVSISSGGLEGNGPSFNPSISADGRFVAFSSSATNLLGAGNDNNNLEDVFVYDRELNTIKRVSIATDGTEGDGRTFAFPAISGDGAFVAFSSDSTNLVQDDLNDFVDVFLHGLQSGVTTRVSVASNGTEGNGDSGGVAVSSDGRFVAFGSSATNLVAADGNNSTDIFIHDHQGGTTERVSLSSNAAEANGGSSDPTISADGQLVAFRSSATNLTTNDSNGVDDIFVQNRTNGQTERVSITSNGTQGDGLSFNPSISADGRLVLFNSDAENLANGLINAFSDIFLHDRQTGATELVSIALTGEATDDFSFEPAISPDGSFAVFESRATNLVAGKTDDQSDIFSHDIQAGTTRRISVTDVSGDSIRSSISSDGRYVAFSSDATHMVDSDTNGATDVFVNDLLKEKIQRVSIASDGSQSDGGSAFDGTSISSDGQSIVFSSEATNLVTDDTNLLADIFLHDLGVSTTQRVSVKSDGTEGTDESQFPSISRDGRFVFFQDFSENLVNDDNNGFPDVFIHDQQLSLTALITRASNGDQTNAPSASTSTGSNGQFVVYGSFADNIVADDNNNKRDIFVHDRTANSTERISVSSSGGESDGVSLNAAISEGGRYVAFDSEATNLVGDDQNGVGDVFVRDRQTNSTIRISVSEDRTESGGGEPTISSSGRFVAFDSQAQLVAKDTNNFADVYVYDTKGKALRLVTLAHDGLSANESSRSVAISPDGNYLAFESRASNLVINDTNNGRSDIFRAVNPFSAAYGNSVLTFIPAILAGREALPSP